MRPSEAVLDCVCCPVCRGKLRRVEQELVCGTSHSHDRFPIVDGVPILIDEQRSIFRLSDFSNRQVASQPQSRLHQFALRWLPSLDLNVSGRRNSVAVRGILLGMSARPKVLNVGGKHPAAAMSGLRRDPGIDCLQCDLTSGGVVDVVADPRALPFADESFDGVFLDGVLEHSVDPQQIVDEVHRVIRQGGVVYADTPFMLPVHGGAFDFQRFSPLAHRRLFAAFSPVNSGVSSGPAAALGYSLQSLFLAGVTRRSTRFAVKTLCRLLFFWIKYFDLLIASRPGAADGALGVFFIGRRSGNRYNDRSILRDYSGATPDLYAGVRSSGD